MYVRSIGYVLVREGELAVESLFQSQECWIWIREGVHSSLFKQLTPFTSPLVGTDQVVVQGAIFVGLRQAYAPRFYGLADVLEQHDLVERRPELGATPDSLALRRIQKPDGSRLGDLPIDLAEVLECGE